MEHLCCISEDAIKIIQDTAFRHPNEESGGLLLGKIDGSRYYVLKATTGGPRSEHGPASFTPDLEFITKKIEKEEERGLIFLGEWHRHPGRMTHPSAGDTHAVKSYFYHNSQLDDYLMIIINLVQGQIDINSFLFSRDGSYKEIENVLKEFGESYEKNFRLEKKIPTKISALDKKLMKERFPEFKFIKDYENTFWEGYIGKYHVKIFPPTFSSDEFRFDVEPHINHKILESLSEMEFPSTPLALMVLETILVGKKERQNGQKDLFSEERIEDKIPSLKKFLRKVKDIFGFSTTESSESSFWYLSIPGKRRLQYEVIELNRVFEEINMYKKSSGEICFKYESNDFNIILLCPNNYPKSPPKIQIFDETRKILRHDKFVEEWLYSHWSSDMILSDVLRKVLRRLET